MSYENIPEMNDIIEQLLVEPRGPVMRRLITEGFLRMYEDGKSGAVDPLARLKIDVANQRIDTLTAIPQNSTTENAELVDVRVGAAGESFATAGGAVREQIARADDEEKHLWSLTTIELDQPTTNWIHGTMLYSNHGYAESARYACTFEGYSYKLRKGTKIFADKGYEFNVLVFSGANAGTYVQEESRDFGTGVYELQNDRTVKYSVRKIESITPRTELTQAEVESMHTHMHTVIDRVETIDDIARETMAAEHAAESMVAGDHESNYELKTKKYPNLFNGHLNWGTIDSQTGEFTANSSSTANKMVCTDFIPVKQGATYTGSYNQLHLVAFYDKYKNFIGRMSAKRESPDYDMQFTPGVTAGSGFSTENAAFVRLVGQAETYVTRGQRFILTESTELQPWHPNDSQPFAVYVDPNNTRTSATKERTYNTIKEAIDSGATTILVAPGTYYENISVSDREELRILLDSSGQTYEGSNYSLKRAIICPCHQQELDNSNFSEDGVGSGTYVCSYNARSDDRIDITYNSNNSQHGPYDVVNDDHNSEAYGFYERRSGGLPTAGGAYRCEIYESTGNYKTSKTLRPAGNLQTCKNTECSMFYDVSNRLLYIHPSRGTIEGKTFYVPMGSFTPIASFSNINNLVLNGLFAEFGNYSGIHLKNVTKATVTNCGVAFTGYDSGFKTETSNVRFENCFAYEAAADGFGISKGGTVDLYNCKSTHNRDDGVSHHHATNGVIMGGEYSNNKKAGIAPTYGAKVNVYSAVCKNNENYGLYYSSDANAGNHCEDGESCKAISCVFEDNNHYDSSSNEYVGKDIFVAHYTLFLKDCDYSTSGTGTAGTISS